MTMELHKRYRVTSYIHSSGCASMCAESLSPLLLLAPSFFLPAAPAARSTCTTIAPTLAPSGLRRLRLRLRLGLGLRREPCALLLVPRLPVQHVARLLLTRRRLFAVPDLVTSATAVEVHVGGEQVAVGAPAEVKA